MQKLFFVTPFQNESLEVQIWIKTFVQKLRTKVEQENYYMTSVFVFVKKQGDEQSSSMYFWLFKHFPQLFVLLLNADLNQLIRYLFIDSLNKDQILGKLHL